MGRRLSWGASEATELDKNPVLALKLPKLTPKLLCIALTRMRRRQQKRRQLRIPLARSRRLEEVRSCRLNADHQTLSIRLPYRLPAADLQTAADCRAARPARMTGHRLMYWLMYSGLHGVHGKMESGHFGDRKCSAARGSVPGVTF